MPVSRVWLWTFVTLFLVGCQSTPSGSKALFDLAHALDREQTGAVAESSNMAADVQDSVDPELPVNQVSWKDDAVLMDVVERELADATPERRRQWLARIDRVDPEEIPLLLSERRRLIDGGAIDSEPPQNSEIHAPMTEQEPGATILVGHDHEIVKPHPLRDTPLQAPSPHGTNTFEADDAPTLQQTALQDQPLGPTAEPAAAGGFINSMFDAFGVAGDRQAAEPVAQANAIRQATVDGHPSPSDRVIEGDSSSTRDAANRSLQTIYWQEELDKLVALLETQLERQEKGKTQVEQDHYLRQNVALRLLYLIGSRRPEALQAIPNEDPAQQEFWTEMMWALSNVFDDEALPDRSLRARETVERLRMAITHIAPEAGLDVRQAVFCRQIDGFGSYELFDVDEFSTGQSVLVYAEAENFGVQQTTQGEFVTRLQSTLDIRQGGVDGAVVFHNELPRTEDVCRSRRRDYFHSYRIKLPTTLAPGPHVLTLTVRDEVSHKLGTATLPFLVR